MINFYISENIRLYTEEKYTYIQDYNYLSECFEYERIKESWWAWNIDGVNVIMLGVCFNITW